MFKIVYTDRSTTDAFPLKTVQSITLLAYLAETHDIWGPFLVVAPASTLHNWQQELTRFVPKLKALPYWGNVKDRTTLRKFWSRKEISYNEDTPFHVVITSYQLVRALPNITMKRADSFAGHARPTVLSEGQVAVHGPRRSPEYQKCCQRALEDPARLSLSESLAFDGYTDSEFHAGCVIPNYMDLR